MAWFIGQSAMMIVIAFLLGLLVGWMIWRRRETAPARSIDDPTTEITYVEEPTAEIPIPNELSATNAAAAAADDDDEGAASEAETAAPVMAADTTPTQTATEAVAVEPVAKETVATAQPARKTRKKAAPAAIPAQRTGAQDADAPATLAAIDDLARVEGIGPKISTALVNAGIRSYEELAKASLSDLQAAVKAARITFTPSISTWSQQAALLGSGDEDGFKSLTDRLIAGREPGARLAGDEESDATPAAPATPVAPAEPDALDRIEGIGPKISAALIASDIRTYHELATAEVPVLEAAISKAGIKFAPSIATWSRQAALLAQGDEDGFRELTDRLVAGREEARQA